MIAPGVLGFALLAAAATSGAGSGTEVDPELRAHEEAFALAPDDLDARWKLAYLHYCRGEWERAAELFAVAPAMGEPPPYPIYMLGAIAENQYRYREAAAHYARVLEIDPGFEPARESLARLAELERRLASFRAADRRLSRELWFVLGGLALLLAVAFHRASPFRAAARR